MALIKCPDCGKMVSDKATMCIGCGRPDMDIYVDSAHMTKEQIEERNERYVQRKVSEATQMHWGYGGLVFK